MTHTRRFLLPLLALGLAALPLRAADPPKLNADEQKVLAELAPDAMAEVAEVVAKLEDWKTKLKAAQDTLKAYQDQVKAAQKQAEDVKAKVDAASAEAMGVVDAVHAVSAKGFDPKAVQALLDLVLPLAEKTKLAEQSAAVKAVVDKVREVQAEVMKLEAQVKADVETKLADVRAKAKALEADAKVLEARGQAYADQVKALAALDETQLRAMVEQRLRAELQEKLLATIDKDVLAAVTALKNPAEFAKTFLDGEFKKWIADNASMEITKEIKARVLIKDPKKSVFAADTDLVVEIAYAGGFKVQATGFNFKYDDTKAPYFTPFFDESKAKLTADGKSLLTATLGKGLEGLGDLLPIGKLPVSVTAKLDDFKPGKPLRCKVAFNLKDMGLPVSLNGEVDLSPGGKMALVGKIEVDAKLPKEYVEIPGTPVAIFKVGGSLDVSGKVKKLELNATLAAASPQADKAVAMEVALGVTFPIKSITVKGQLLVARESVCDLKGTLGELPSGKKGLEVSLMIPGGSGPGADALKRFVKGEAELTLTKEGLTASGMLDVCKVYTAKFDLAVNRDGSGHFCGAWDRNIFGVKPEATITVRFDAGFTNPVLETSFNLEIDLGEKFDLLRSCSVGVRLKASADSTSVTAYGFGTWVTIDNLGPRDSLFDKLVAEFKNKLKQWEEDLRDWLAKQDPTNPDSPLRSGLRDLDPGNKNGAVGRLIHGLKDVKVKMPNIEFDPGKVEGEVLKAGGQISQTVKDGLGGLKPPPVKKPGGVVGKILFGAAPPPPEWERLLAAADRLPAEQRNELLLALLATGVQPPLPDGEFVTQLGGLVLSLQDIDLVEQAKPVVSRTPKGRSDRRSRARVRVFAPTLAAVNKDELLIGFTVQVDGSASTVESGRATDRREKSILGGGNVRLRRQADGRWKGKIEQPKLAWADCCYQDLSLQLSQAVEGRLERLPGVEVDGLRIFHEKALWVNNTTKSDLTVHVQFYTYDRGGKVADWRWLPGDPDAGRRSHTFRLKAGEKKKVTAKLVGLVSDKTLPDFDIDLSKLGLGGSRKTKVGGGTVPDYPLTANLARVWAEADDGEDWYPYRDKDFPLVNENPKLNGQRSYQADTLGETTFNFLPLSGFRTYDERVVGFTNATAKPVRVALKYRITENGKTTWRELDEFVVKPNETIRPREKDDQLVRASAIKFVALSEQFLYRDYQDKPLWTVDETDGVRLYKAEKVGTYTHTLKPTAATIPGGGK